MLSRTALLRRLGHGSWAKAALEQYSLRDAQRTLLKEEVNQRKLLFHVESPTRGRFLLRVYRPTGPSEDTLRSELLWLQALRRDTSLYVPEPIPAADGSLVTDASLPWASEARRCVLLRWLPGQRKKAGLSPADLSLVGSYMARLHQHSEQYAVPEGFVRPRAWDWDWVFGEAVPLWTEGKSVYSRSELDVFRAAAGRVRRDLQELDKSSDVFGIIHRDLHLDNFLFQDGEVYAIDFENCGWGYYLFDLAVTLSSLEIWSLEGYGVSCTPLQAALLESYQRERPLPEGYQRHLQTFMAMRLARWVNVTLGQEPHTRPSRLLSETVGVLKEFVASEGEATGFGLSWSR